MRWSLIRSPRLRPVAIGRRELALVMICAMLPLGYSASAAAAIDAPSGALLSAAGTLRDVVSARDRNPRDHGSKPHNRNHDRSQQRPTIGPEQAAERARARFGGRVLNVILDQGPSGPYYRVKLLQNGRVRVVDVDAHR